MVVTESKALKWIANEELAGRISSLQPMHQAYLRTKKDVAMRTGCSSCNLSEPEFASLKEKALAHIRKMSDPDLQTLKNHLVVKQLIFHDTRGGKREKIIR